jgi:acyl phosphate:glycerol-3-phosphate acyltransferase
MYLAEIGKDIGFIAASFFLGSIPFCYILGKIAGKKNLTEIGDKNPGGWNLIFNVSKIWGIIGLLLDMAKGFFAYYLVLMFAYKSSIDIFGTNHNELIAVLAGCAAVAGHCYTPFLKYSGGKGLATWIGFILSASWFSLPVAAVGWLVGVFFARNMVWAISLGIVFTGVFLWIYTGAAIYIPFIIILFIIMIPKQLNRDLTLGKNFKFRKESTIKNILKPKIK